MWTYAEPVRPPGPPARQGARRTPRLVAVLFAVAFLTCAVEVLASPVEYYRYVLEQDADTTVAGTDTVLVVVASYDTVAMELTAEILESPLGTAVQTAPLSWQDGHLVGTVVIALAGSGSELVRLASDFDRASPVELSQGDSLALDLAIPPEVAIVGLLPDSAAGGVTIQKEVVTQAGTNGNAESSISLTAGLTGGSTNVELTGSITLKEGPAGASVERSGMIKLALDGIVTLSTKLAQGVSQFGKDYLSGSLSATVTSGKASATLGAGLTKDDQGTKAQASLAASYQLSSLYSTNLDIDYWRDHLRDYVSGRLTLGIDVGAGTTLGIGVCSGNAWGNVSLMPYVGLCFSHERGGELLAGTEATCVKCLLTKMLAAFCWPDTNTCVEQPPLTSECPWNEEQTYELLFHYSFDPSNPYAMDRFVEVHPIGAPPRLAVASGDWYTDAFFANETPGLPGAWALSDTCAAHIMTGTNQAQVTGNELRFNVPGDTVAVTVSGGGSDPARMDAVFRILPGPGNYMTKGDRTSGLRRVPTSPAPATPGDGSFWGQYLADPGPFSKGNHAGGWNPDTWNSVRIDTLELNWFPCEGRAANLPSLTPGSWMTAIHEADPNFAALGILKHRCFLIDTSATATLGSDNITCSNVPAWLTALPSSYTGWDGEPQTREYTKIFPDGLLTPGSHVQYFLRYSSVGSMDFVMCPDTNMICPQEGSDYDGHRWQEFGVLPDRWKDEVYGGIGSACILVVDYCDRGGDERAFIGLADTIGLTTAAKRGAHNGWRCDASYVASDGSHDYWGETDCGTNPAIAVWAHGGGAGSAFDLYRVRNPERSTGSANRLGARLANRSGMGLLDGKYGRQAPTPEMLRASYNAILVMTGDLNANVLGPLDDQGSDDVGILEDFLSYDTTPVDPRVLWVMGNGFAESESNTGGAHAAFLADELACSLRHPSYCELSSNVEAFPDLTTTSAVSAPGRVLSVETGTGTACGGLTNDVLEVNTVVPGAMPSSYYEGFGAGAPYVAGVFAPATPEHPFVTLVDGYGLRSLRSHGGNTNIGRLLYFMDVLVSALGSICQFAPTPAIDVPGNSARAVEFLDQVWGNPVTAGRVATVRFGLARADRVEIRIYDVTGRLLRTLADRDFAAGEHSLKWDGTDDNGRAVSRGIYFTQVRYQNSGFVGAKKLAILR